MDKGHFTENVPEAKKTFLGEFFENVLRDRIYILRIYIYVSVPCQGRKGTRGGIEAPPPCNPFTSHRHDERT